MYSSTAIQTGTASRGASAVDLWRDCESKVARRRSNLSRVTDLTTSLAPRVVVPVFSRMKVARKSRGGTVAVGCSRSRSRIAVVSTAYSLTGSIASRWVESQRCIYRNIFKFACNIVYKFRKSTSGISEINVVGGLLFLIH